MLWYCPISTISMEFRWRRGPTVIFFFSKKTGIAIAKALSISKLGRRLIDRYVSSGSPLHRARSRTGTRVVLCCGQTCATLVVFTHHLVDQIFVPFLLFIVGLCQSFRTVAVGRHALSLLSRWSNNGGGRRESHPLRLTVIFSRSDPFDPKRTVSTNCYSVLLLAAKLWCLLQCFP